MRTPNLLSTSRIASTKPGRKDRWLSDDVGFKGVGRLTLRITPQDVRRFYYRSPRTQGVTTTISLGLYSRTHKPGHLTLNEARLLAQGYMALRTAPPGLATLHHASGLKTQETSRSQAPAAAASEFLRAKLTVWQMCEVYINRLKADKKHSAAEVEKRLRRHVQRWNLADAPASEVSTQEFAALLRHVKAVCNDSLISWRRVRSYLHAAYALAIASNADPESSAEGIDPSIIHNPITKIPAHSKKERPRKRVLQDATLAEVWRQLRTGADADALPKRAARLCLLLGGQRGMQLLRARNCDVDLALGTILLHDPKGTALGRDHLLPIPPLASEEVRWLLHHSRAMCSTLLFANEQRDQVLTAGTVSKVITEICRSMISEGSCEKGNRFQFSDLRRTVETRLASLRVPSKVLAHLLSHGISGVQDRHYNMWEYMPEKKAALELWEALLTSLEAANPKPFELNWFSFQSEIQAPPKRAPNRSPSAPSG